MKLYRHVLVLLDTLLIVCLFHHRGFAANTSNSGIVYLQMKMKNGVITLMDASIVPGVCRYPSYNNHGDIIYRVENTSGVMVGYGAIRDPGLVQGDYIDPDNPGRLKGEAVKLNEAFFVVRIPYTPSLGNISFYTGTAAANRGTLVGTVSLEDINSRRDISSAAASSVRDRAEIQLVQGDSSENRAHYIIFSEGYTQAELNSGTFINHIKTLLGKQFAFTPYKEYKSRFNVWAISVASSQPGAGGYFGSTWSGRLLYCPNMTKAYDLAKQLKPNWDMGLVLVNTTEYGGAGSEIAVASAGNSMSWGLVTHETGHGYAGLGDEYDSPGATPAEYPNTTQEKERTKIKWKAWINTSTPIPTPETSAYGTVVGLFEGACYMTTGWYRPKLKCNMNWLQDPFCEVCRETIIWRIYKKTSPVDSYTPTALTVDYNSIPGKKLIISSVQPQEKSIRTLWSINGSAQPGKSDTMDLSKVPLQTGANTVIAYTADTTTWVRIPENLPQLRDTVTWTITYNGNAIITSAKPAILSFRVCGGNRPAHAEFRLPSTQEVALLMYTSRGSLISTVYQGCLEKGEHRLPIPSLAKLSGGIYFVSLSTAGFTAVRKLQK